MNSSTPSTTPISLRCPKCQARLKAPRQLAGKVCPCPQCRTQVLVRAPIPSDAEIAIVLEEDRKSTSNGWN